MEPAYDHPPSALIWVPGVPAPGGSKKAFKHAATGRIVVTDDAKGNRDWKSRVADFASRAYAGPLLAGPVEFWMEFHFLRPRSHYRTGRNAALLRGDAPAYPAGRPDLTKLVRAAEDALKGVVWADDGQVVGQGNRKVYGEKPGVRICVRRVTRSGIGNHPIGEDWLS